MSDLSGEMLQRAANDAWVREQDLSHELLRPFRLMKTGIVLDGNQWCVLYGDNLQDGVAGFGESPDLASRAFDTAWYEKLATKGGGT